MSGTTTPYDILTMQNEIEQITRVINYKKAPPEGKYEPNIVMRRHGACCGGSTEIPVETHTGVRGESLTELFKQPLDMVEKLKTDKINALLLFCKSQDPQSKICITKHGLEYRGHGRAIGTTFIAYAALFLSHHYFSQLISHKIELPEIQDIIDLQMNTSKSIPDFLAQIYYDNKVLTPLLSHGVRQEQILPSNFIPTGKSFASTIPPILEGNSLGFLDQLSKKLPAESLSSAESVVSSILSDATRRGLSKNQLFRILTEGLIRSRMNPQCIIHKVKRMRLAPLLKQGLLDFLKEHKPSEPQKLIMHAFSSFNRECFDTLQEAGIAFELEAPAAKSNLLLSQFESFVSRSIDEKLASNICYFMQKFADNGGNVGLIDDRGNTYLHLLFQNSRFTGDSPTRTALTIIELAHTLGLPLLHKNNDGQHFYEVYYGYSVYYAKSDEIRAYAALIQKCCDYAHDLATPSTSIDSNPTVTPFHIVSTGLTKNCSPADTPARAGAGAGPDRPSVNIL